MKNWKQWRQLPVFGGLLLGFCCLPPAAGAEPAGQLPYRDAGRPVDERVDDLLARMTLEEKVGQLMMLNGIDCMEEAIRDMHVGTFLNIKGEEADRTIREADRTRLGIPVLLAIDSVHGYSFWPGATIFPSQLALSCSWNPQRAKEMGEVTAAEMCHTGVVWTFAPVFCLGRDPRWGRLGETFGEDPYLLSVLGTAMIEGLQGERLDDPAKVIACAKHYVGYGETQGGRDAAEADLSYRKLQSYFLPPFEAAAKAGAATFMTAYQAIDGVPMTANRRLLREVLKGDWQFPGVVVTDWNNVGTLISLQRICDNLTDAAAITIAAGNDMSMATPEFYQSCLEAVRSGRLAEADVDEAARRVLKLKFELGLFENPRRPDLAAAQETIGCAAHRDLALDTAREALVLLKNDGLLPLQPEAVKTIALVGPAADSPLALSGDWSGETPNGFHPRRCFVTVKDALPQQFNGRILHAPGALFSLKAPESSTPAEAERRHKELEAQAAAALDQAKTAMAAADLVVVVIGDSPDYWGEWHSTATLEPMGSQPELLQAVLDSGKPFIVDVMSSKPLLLPEEVLARASGVFQQFSPGMLGGRALAEALFGKLNPSGRLTISVPRHPGQLPVWYQQVRGSHGHYADLTDGPRYVFGEGLSYSPIEYGQASLDRDSYWPDDTIQLTVTVRNTGKSDGVEVIQAYVSDLVTGTTWAEQELKGFARVAVPAGESRQVTIPIAVSSCSIVDDAGNRVVEPGEFELRVGKSAADIQHRLPFKVLE